MIPMEPVFHRVQERCNSQLRIVLLSQSKLEPINICWPIKNSFGEIIMQKKMFVIIYDDYVISEVYCSSALIHFRP